MSLYIQSDGRDMCVWDDDVDPPRSLLTEHEADYMLWRHLVATLPTRPETPPEPTDPAVRVVGPDGREWASVTTVARGTVWVSADSLIGLPWLDVVREYGPLTIVSPDSPAPDDRPLQIGDRVKVADDAPAPRGLLGQSAVIVGRSWPRWRVGYAGVFASLDEWHLTLLPAEADEEAAR